MEALNETDEFDDAGVVMQEETDELDGRHPELVVLLVDALEKTAEFLGVEARVDGGLVAGVLKQQAGWGQKYLVRLRIRAMNLSMPGSRLHSINQLIYWAGALLNTR